MGMYLASPWPRQDLFFLNDALRHGGSFAEIASFLCRDEDEVREKARELKLIGPASVWPFDHDGGADHVGRSPLPSRTPQHVGELAPLHSITSSARASSVGAISKRLRSLEVDDQLELGGLLDGKVCGARLRGSRLPLNSVARVKKSPAEAGQDTKRVENTPA